MDKILTIQNSKGLSVSYKDNGDFLYMSIKDIRIHLCASTRGEIFNREAYLRIYVDGIPKDIYPLHRMYTTHFYSKANLLQWSGECPKAKFKISLYLVPDKFIWINQVEIHPYADLLWDIVWVEDRGLANADLLAGAELYASQYIDFSCTEIKNHGYVLCSRQNLLSPLAPSTVDGIQESCVGFSTNGHEFYGKAWEQNMYPQGLKKDLGNVVTQEQFSLFALQSKKYSNSGKINVISVYNPESEATKNLDFERWVKALEYSNLDIFNSEFIGTKVKSTNSKFLIFSSESLSDGQIDCLYPQRILEEYDKQGALIAFFTPEFHHVVLKEKEYYSAQSHCHIVRGGEVLYPTEKTPVFASFMNGCFLAHVASGNSIFNTFISSSILYIDLFKRSGVRIKIFINEAWFQLGVPASFEMSRDKAKWVYLLEDDFLLVEAYFESAYNTRLEIKSQSNRKYEIEINIFLCDGIHENIYTPILSKKNNTQVIVKSNTQSMSSYNPVLFEFEHSQIISEESDSFITSRGYSDYFSMNINMQAYESDLFQYPMPLKIEKMDNTHIQNILNTTCYWFSHNAIIHFSVMFGIEQTKGAAWGVRDVLQGSLEYCFANYEHESARVILDRVFSQQTLDNGDWPQWFMMDEFLHIRDSHSHGDIIIWIFKALYEYINIYGMDILDAELPFYDTQNKKHTKNMPMTLHISKALNVIEEMLIPEAHFLPAYSGGDWNDSLQPINETLKNNLISVWSSFLLAQYLTEFYQITKGKNYFFEKKLKIISEKVKFGIDKIIENYEYPPGFLYVDRESNKVNPLMYKNENQYPISYRLLPLKRAIKSKLISREQAENLLSIIDTHLSHWDGTRLLDYVIEYKGGKSLYFKRMEQAAFFGREIGLMYTHAHLRYVEALLDLRSGNKAIEELLKIIPMEITKRNKNALPRQSNAYFASSDLVTKTRYDLQGVLHANASKNMCASGGWRIYSSGPGIFLNLLNSSIFGIRVTEESLYLNPCIGSVFGKEIEISLPHPISDCDHRLILKINSQFKEYKICNVKINGRSADFNTVYNNYGYAGIELPPINSSITKICLEIS